MKTRAAPLPLFLTALAALAALTPVAAQEDNDGTHSTVFDPKYDLPENLLITPRTHPALFSFTGRWLLSPARPTRPQPQLHQATAWPSNSVTVLVYGSAVSVQLVPPAVGWTDNYHFFASVDGGADVRYDLEPFNSSALTDAGEAPWFDIDIAGFAPDTGALLQPHTLRLTSAAESPLWLEGVNVQRTLVSQGREWSIQQDRRVVLEFITDTRGDPDSMHYRVAEALHVRHSHSSTADTCFLQCKPGVPGLTAQYFLASPHPHPAQPFRFPGVSTRPPVSAAPSTHVFLDADLRGVPVAALRGFIAELRGRAHPLAVLAVVARPATSALVAAATAAQDGVRMVMLRDGAAEDAYLRALRCGVLARCDERATWGVGVAALGVGLLAVWSSRGVVAGAVAAVCGRRRGPKRG